MKVYLHCVLLNAQNYEIVTKPLGVVEIDEEVERLLDNSGCFPNILSSMQREYYNIANRNFTGQYKLLEVIIGDE